MTHGGQLTHSVRHEILEDSLNSIIVFDHYDPKLNLILIKVQDDEKYLP